MKTTFTQLALCAFALASQAHATPPEATPPQTAPSEADQAGSIFAVLASSINTRSLHNCEPAVDVPELSAQRESLIFLKGYRASLDSQVSAMVPLAMANNANYSVCFDKTLVGSGNAAVVYNDRWRMIVLNPEAPNLPATLMQSVSALKSTWDQVRDKLITMEQAEGTPLAIALDPAKPGAKPAALPPHRMITLVKEIEARSQENCDSSADLSNASPFRPINIGVPNAFVRYDQQADILKLLEAVNREGYVVCYDNRLDRTANAAVVYSDKANTISLNPMISDIQPTLLKAYKAIAAAPVAKLTALRIDSLPDTALAPDFPPDAPRKGFRIIAPPAEPPPADPAADKSPETAPVPPVMAAARPANPQ